MKALNKLITDNRGKETEEIYQMWEDQTAYMQKLKISTRQLVYEYIHKMKDQPDDLFQLLNDLEQQN